MPGRDANPQLALGQIKARRKWPEDHPAAKVEVVDQIQGQIQVVGAPRRVVHLAVKGGIQSYTGRIHIRHPGSRSEGVAYEQDIRTGVTLKLRQVTKSAEVRRSEE